MDYIIEMLNITKKFQTLVANDNITLQVKKGEVHALLGENGAGKSTLMSILFGLYSADEGVIKIAGEEVKIKNPNDANRYKIGMVHQHFKLVEDFTVLENIILGAEPNNGLYLDLNTAGKEVSEIAKQYNLHLDLNAKIKDISVGMQQKVEIMKMLYRDADILILDEPTAVLTPQEIKELMNIIRGFSEEGKTTIIITHKLDEIKLIADRCTILRKGKLVGTVDVESTSVEELAEMMVGHKVLFDIEKKPSQPAEPLLEVIDLSHRIGQKNVLNKLNLSVKGGEIVGIAGVDGNGQTELVRVISGLDKLQQGQIFINRFNATNKTIKEKYEIGMGHIPEDRQRFGLVLDYHLEENLILQSYYRKPFQKNGFMNREITRRYAQQLIDDFDIRTSSGPDTIVRKMSGGNQQKAIIARELSRDPRVLLAVQPTRGLDVGAIEYIHKQIIDHRDKGHAILLVSFELDEIMALSDRIYVMYNGEIVFETTPELTTTNQLGFYMTGAKRGVANG